MNRSRWLLWAGSMLSACSVQLVAGTAAAQTAGGVTTQTPAPTQPAATRPASSQPNADLQAEGERQREAQQMRRNLQADDAERRLREALQMYRDGLGDENLPVATTLNDLASLLKAKGDYGAAEPLYREALQTYRELLGDEHPLVVTSLNNLADLLRVKGDYAAAEPLSREALRMYRKLLGDEHPLVALSLNNLAALLQDRGDYGAAEPLYREALQMYRKLLGDEHPDVATSLNNLALLLRAKGDYGAAEPLFREALQMYGKLLGDEHLLVALSLNNLAALLQDKGDYGAAEPLLREALQMYGKLLGDEHPDVATSLNNLALLLRAKGDYGAAEPLFREALQMYGKLLGDEHPLVALSLSNLAALLQDKGDYGAAEPLLREALQMRRKLLGDEHPDVATCLNNLALLLRAKGDYGAAEPLFREVLQMRRKLLGDEHPAVATSLNNLALLLQAKGDYGAAEPLYREALQMYRKVFGDEHPDIATSLNNLALLLRAKGDYGAAEPLFREALQMYRKLLGDEHPLVALSLSNLALLLQAKGDYGSAEPLYREALPMRRKLLGDEHPDVALSLNNLATLLQVKGDYGAAEPLYREAVAIARHGDEDLPVWDANFHLWAANLARLYLERDRPADAVPLLVEAIAQVEWLRERARGYSEQERGRLFEHLKRFGEYELMIDAQSRLGRPEEALRYLEQGRGRSLLDFLERAGDDPLQMARRRALSDGNHQRVREIDQLTKELGEADGRVSVRRGEAVLTRGRQVGLRRELRDLTEKSPGPSRDERAQVPARKSEIDSELGEVEAQLRRLERQLGQALSEQRELSRRRFQLIQDVVTLAKPAGPAAIRGMLGSDARLLLYSVTSPKALLLVVSPHGQALRHYELAWPQRSEAEDGKPEPVTDETLTREVERYVLGCLRRGFTRQRGALDAQEGEAAARAAEQLDKRLAEIDARLRGLARKDVPKGPGEANLAELGHRLFAALIPPELWVELKTCSQVYVVPHGALHRLPLEMLVVEPDADPARCRFWLDDGPPIAYGASGSMLLWSRAQRDKQERRPLPHQVVALGGAIYRRGGDEPPADWPGQGVYVQRVATGSDPAIAGLQAGDVVLRFDGAVVADRDALDLRVLRLKRAIDDGERADEALVVHIWRAGREQELRLPAASLSSRDVKLARSATREDNRGVIPARGAKREDEAYASAVRGSLETRLGELGELPGTVREVTAIYRSLSGREYAPESRATPGPARLLVEEAASESELRRVAPQGRYVHLAAHALADETDAMSWSGLALTVPPISTPADDGFLTLGELLTEWGDKLSACELVVLSACQTQVGPQQKDEAVFALPLGFQFAGTPSVIASLWSVNDASTAALMSDFYARLGTSERDNRSTDSAETKLFAFTAARRALRERYPEPYFWAPFIYVGDPR